MCTPPPPYAPTSPPGARPRPSPACSRTPAASSSRPRAARPRGAGPSAWALPVPTLRRRPQNGQLRPSTRMLDGTLADDLHTAARPDHHLRLRCSGRRSARPPAVGHADYSDAALLLLAAVQTKFYDQLDANGEGGHTAELALSWPPSTPPAPPDRPATGSPSTACDRSSREQPGPCRPHQRRLGSHAPQSRPGRRNR